jgi:predicted transcriptional regulator
VGKHDWKFKSRFGGGGISKGPTYALKPVDLKVYQALLGHYNRTTALCYPSIQTVADEANLDEKTVKASRNRLEELGLLRTWF